MLLGIVLERIKAQWTLVVVYHSVLWNFPFIETKTMRVEPHSNAGFFQIWEDRQILKLETRNVFSCPVKSWTQTFLSTLKVFFACWGKPRFSSLLLSFMVTPASSPPPVLTIALNLFLSWSLITFILSFSECPTYNSTPNNHYLNSLHSAFLAYSSWDHLPSSNMRINLYLLVMLITCQALLD